MELLHPDEVWRRVPPEEKLELMAQSHAAGVRGTLMVIGVCGTIAVGLKMMGIFWASLFAAPLVFQFSSSKAWRRSRPKTILEYLAARSAARRFAFAINAKDLTIQMIFKGTLLENKPANISSARYDEHLDRYIAYPVWITLLADSFVMLKEGTEGADNVLSHLITEKIKFQGRSEGGEGEYSSTREILITVQDKRIGSKEYTLRSHQPAALIVFEKRVQKIYDDYLHERAKAKGLRNNTQQQTEALPPPTSRKSSLDFSGVVST
jgi:hypothetical protein